MEHFENSLVVALVLGMIVLASGCDANGNSDDGMDTAPGNITVFEVQAEARQVVAGSSSGAGATARFELHRDTGALQGAVDLQGLSAAAIQLRRGFAGESGPVVFELESGADARWVLPADTLLGAEQRVELESGGLYLLVISGAQAGGALRGQLITGGTRVHFFELSGRQAVPTVDTTAMARAAITIAADGSTLTIHVNTAGLENAFAGRIHRALAGMNGPAVIELAQDVDDNRHWFAANQDLGSANLAELDNGHYYVNVHSADYPDGVVRGQLPGENVEILFAALSPDDVVPPAANDASGLLAVTLRLTERDATFHLNTKGAGDATGAAIRRAPLAQNGPVLVNLQQDTQNFSHWFRADVPLTQTQLDALRNREWYAEVYTPAFPQGALRGQLQPGESATDASDRLVIDSTTPANGAVVRSFPDTIRIRFNLPPSVPEADQFQLRASGGDHSFNDGNETRIPSVNLFVEGATVTLDFSGVDAAGDSYELRISGTGAGAVTDGRGHVLDGDRDGTDGGDARITFTVNPSDDSGPTTSTTLSEIQARIFNNSCAFSGCHVGAGPAAGMNLSAGRAFDNLVNVASSQNPGLIRVIPGNAGDSLLVQKLEGTAAVGARMPLGGPPLSNSQIQSVREWIDAGAENN